MGRTDKSVGPTENRNTSRRNALGARSPQGETRACGARRNANEKKRGGTDSNIRPAVVLLLQERNLHQPKITLKSTMLGSRLPPLCSCQSFFGLTRTKL